MAQDFVGKLHVLPDILLVVLLTSTVVHLPMYILDGENTHDSYFSSRLKRSLKMSPDTHTNRLPKFRHCNGKCIDDFTTTGYDEPVFSFSVIDKTYSFDCDSRIKESESRLSSLDVAVAWMSMGIGDVSLEVNSTQPFAARVFHTPKKSLENVTVLISHELSEIEFVNNDELAAGSYTLSGVYFYPRPTSVYLQSTTNVSDVINMASGDINDL